MSIVEPDESREVPAAGELRYAVAQLEDIQLRAPRTEANGSDDIYLDGYAAVFNQETTLYDDQFGVMREMIQPGAFADALADQPDVHLVIGHNLDLPMARTNNGDGPGSLMLSEDPRGLKVSARLNPRISYIADLAENMRDGVVDQMSFAFTVDPEGREYVENDELPDGREDVLRKLTKIKKLYDVTVTPQGAYSQTSASLRGLSGLARRAAGHTVGVTERGTAAAVTQPGGGLNLRHDLALREIKLRSKRLAPRST